MFPNTTPSSSRARARDLSYTVGSHKLTCVVHTSLVRSLVVFATWDDGQRIVLTYIVSQFQRAGLRAHGTQVSDLCAQPTFCPLTVSAGYKPAGRTGPRPVFHQSNPNARKSSRGSSKLQLPNEVTNFRLSRSRLTSIFHSRHVKNSSVKESESSLSSFSMSTIWSESHF